MPGYEIIDNKEKKAVSKIFDEGAVLFAHGFPNIRKKYYVRELEQKFSSLMKCKYALPVASGTAAIKIALKAIGIKPGDEVITQAFNFVATVEAIIDCGAKPIIVGVDNSLNICPLDLITKITKKTKAIIPVNMLGASCNFKEIKKIAIKHKIRIIEDNCEAFMGKYEKRYLGTICDIGILSLDYGKFITSGEGGVILTNNKKYYKFCKQYHDHGHENSPKYSRGNDNRKIVGFNYRMTELQATICIEQLKKAKLILKKNKERYKLLDKKINKNINKRLIIENSEPNYDTFIFYVKKSLKLKIIKYLKKIKLGTKNLPDAIKWHCSYYWGHAVDKKQIRNSVRTKNLLTSAIAIPILINKNLKFYNSVVLEINKIYEKYR